LVNAYVKNTDLYRCPTNPAARIADEQASCANTPEPRFMRGYFYYHAFFRVGGAPGRTRFSHPDATNPRPPAKPRFGNRAARTLGRFFGATGSTW